MKKCSKCLIEKPLDQFDKRGLTSAGNQMYRADCKACKKSIDNSYYLATKDVKTARSLAAMQSRRQFIYDYLLQHPCVDCGEDDIVVLEFDHVRGTKVRNISDMVARKASKQTITQEIEKCDVRCANCHRKVTAKRGNWFVLQHIPSD